MGKLLTSSRHTPVGDKKSCHCLYVFSKLTGAKILLTVPVWACWTLTFAFSVYQWILHFLSGQQTLGYIFQIKLIYACKSRWVTNIHIYSFTQTPQRIAVIWLHILSGVLCLSSKFRLFFFSSCISQFVYSCLLKQSTIFIN